MRHKRLLCAAQTTQESSREAAWIMNLGNQGSEWLLWARAGAAGRNMLHPSSSSLTKIPLGELVRVTVLLMHLVLPFPGTHSKMWHTWSSEARVHYHQESYRHFQGNWERLNTESLSVSKKITQPISEVASSKSGWHLMQINLSLAPTICSGN